MFTLISQVWKWERSIRSLLKRRSWIDIGLEWTEGPPEDAIFKPISTKWISPFLTRLYDIWSDHLTCVTANGARMSEFSMKQIGVHLKSEETFPRELLRPKVDESSREIVLRTLKRELLVLMIFHHWLHYAKIVSRVVYTVEWRHERRIHHVLA